MRSLLAVSTIVIHAQPIQEPAMNPRILTLPLALIAVAGCAPPPSQVTSFVDPAYARTTFRRIAIAADVGNLATMRELESAMAASLAEEGTSAIARFELLSPTREWSRARMLAAFDSVGADAYMMITVDTSQIVEHHEPSTSTTTTTRTTPKKGEDETTETTVTEHKDGYSYRSVITRFRMTLRPIRSEGIAWLAVAELASDTPARVKDYCEDIVAKLQSDRLVVGPAR
jgi:hypothetical protein